jgi:hypothetical protein
MGTWTNRIFGLILPLCLPKNRLGPRLIFFAAGAVTET